MAFASWAAELVRFKDAYNRLTIDELNKAGFTDKNGNSIIFRKLEDMRNHMDWLESKALQESNPGGAKMVMGSIAHGG